MNSLARESQRHIPLWLGLVAGAVALGGMAALFLLDTWIKRQSWAIYIVALPAYILLQVCAEGALEGVGTAKHWVARCFAMAVLVGFYALWFWYL
jgi:hypothetical protein